MTKNEMAAVVAEKAGLSDKNALVCVTVMCDLIAERIAEDMPITLHGVGTFKTVTRAARQGFNPRTGQKITIPAKNQFPVFPVTPFAVRKNFNSP